MTVAWNVKCLLVTLYIVTLHGAIQTLGDKTCQVSTEFSLPKDTAKAKELVDESRPGSPVTESTAWRTGESEAPHAGREAMFLKMEQLEKHLEKQQEKQLELEKQLETGLKRAGEAIVDLKKEAKTDAEDFKKSVEEVDSKVQIVEEYVQRQIQQTNARLLCSAAGIDMTFTQWGCFKKLEIKKTWSDARDHCASLGLELASFEKGPGTRQELLQMGKDIALKDKKAYWIGLTRHASGEWRWLSGAQLDEGSPLWIRGGLRKVEGEPKGFFNPSFGVGDNTARNKLYVLCAVPSLDFRDSGVRSSVR